MELHIRQTADDAATDAARHIGARLAEAIDERGGASLALSGGSSPLPMFDALAAVDIAWSKVVVFQVDERVVDPDDTDNNGRAIRERLLSRVPAASSLFEVSSDMTDVALAEEAERVAAEMATRLGGPPRFDVIHLGLGSDGHTASWAPDAPILDELHRWVVPCEELAGVRRLSITPPVVNAARSVVWLVTGDDKREMLARMMRHDESIPAGRVLTIRQAVFSSVDRRSEPRT